MSAMHHPPAVHCAVVVSGESQESVPCTARLAIDVPVMANGQTVRSANVDGSAALVPDNNACAMAG